MTHLTFKEQQAHDKRSARDAFTLFALALLCMTLMFIAFAHAYDRYESGVFKRTSDARLTRTGSRLCTHDGRTLDQLRDDEPLQSMRASWCKN